MSDHNLTRRSCAVFRRDDPNTPHKFGFLAILMNHPDMTVADFLDGEHTDPMGDHFSSLEWVILTGCFCRCPFFDVASELEVILKDVLMRAFSRFGELRMDINEQFWNSLRNLAGCWEARSERTIRSSSWRRKTADIIVRELGEIVKLFVDVGGEKEHDVLEGMTKRMMARLLGSIAIWCPSQLDRRMFPKIKRN